MSKIKPQDKPHYVNNAQFSQAIVDYVVVLNEAKKTQEPLPKVPDYVAMCFLKICEGLSHKSNFVRYSYRDEMVENCLKAVENYDIEAATRTGKPNAFAYFTQISWYAFLRRIEREKKQQDIKMRYIEQSGIENFLDNELGDAQSANVAAAFVDSLRSKIDDIKEKDSFWKEVVKKERKLRAVNVDSDLSDFIS
jgi:hypothetical protein